MFWGGKVRVEVFSEFYGKCCKLTCFFYATNQPRQEHYKS